MVTNFNPAIIVHGGAGAVKDHSLSARLDGCKEAALAGWRLLERGGSAIDAGEAAVVVLEDNPLFNAGTGSTLNLLGKVEMDAAIMEGRTLRAGAVAVVSGVKNPIRLARRVMEDGRHVMLACEGALQFAREVGFPECPAEALIVERAQNLWDEKHGTVGCVALDSSGHIAAATSTGGTFNKFPGRVGDSPLLGCGTCADDCGAVSCTGDGEAIMRIVLAKTALGFIRDGADAPSAAQQAVALLSGKTGSMGGLIVIDQQGRIGYARNTTHMPVCFITKGGVSQTDS